MTLAVGTGYSRGVKVTYLHAAFVSFLDRSHKPLSGYWLETLRHDAYGDGRHYYDQTEYPEGPKKDLRHPGRLASRRLWGYLKHLPDFRVARRTNGNLPCQLRSYR